MERAVQERARRLDLSLPVRFAEPGGETVGRCLNLSESGMLAIFDRALELWVTGRISITVDRTRVEVTARVARVGEREAGLAFLFVDEAERRQMIALVAFVASQTTLTGYRPPF